MRLPIGRGSRRWIDRQPTHGRSRHSRTSLVGGVGYPDYGSSRPDYGNGRDKYGDQPEYGGRRGYGRPPGPGGGPPGSGRGPGALGCGSLGVANDVSISVNKAGVAVAACFAAPFPPLTTGPGNPMANSRTCPAAAGGTGS